MYYLLFHLVALSFAPTWNFFYDFFVAVVVVFVSAYVERQYMHSHNRLLMDENMVLHEWNDHVDRKIAKGIKKNKIKSISTENRKLYNRYFNGFFLLIIRTILFIFSFASVSLYADMHTTTIALTDTVHKVMTRLCSPNATNSNADCICNVQKLRRSVCCARAVYEQCAFGNMKYRVSLFVFVFFVFHLAIFFIFFVSWYCSVWCGVGVMI